MRSSEAMMRSEANFPDPTFRDAISAVGTSTTAAPNSKIHAYLANIGRREFLAAAGIAAVGFGATPGQQIQAYAQTNTQTPADNSAKALPAARSGNTTVEVERLDGHILLIRINRPPENRLDPATFIELGKAFYQLDHDDELRVAVLHAAGPDFCPGIDPLAWAQTFAVGTFAPDATEFVNPFGTVPPLRARRRGARRHRICRS